MDAVYDAVIGAVNLRQCRAATWNPNAQIDRQRVSGGLDASEIYLMGAEPRAQFESFDLAGVITGISVSAGLSVASGTITLPYQKRANMGTFAGVGSHFTLTGANGLTIPKSFQANQNDAGASVSLETVFLSTTGLAAPVTAAVNQSLAAQAFNASYRMGPVYIGGVQVPQITGIRVDTGLRLEVLKYDGAVYPVKVVIVSRDPAIEITFEDFDALGTYGPIFANMGSGCAAYFRKKSDGGTVVADASTVHCKLSFAAGITNVQSASASEQGNGSATMRLEGKTLTASNASAIP